jgi:hypothetical protein
MANSAGVTGLVLKSDANGAGSLIHNTANVSATVESFMSTLDSYHFVASPVADALSEVFHYAWLYQWNEPTQYWDNIVATTVSILPGKGYSLVLSNVGGGTPSQSPNNPVIYTGILNNGLVGSDNNISNTDGTDASIDGYNLVGNPYPSAIDWDATTGWTKTNVDNAIYFFKTNAYASYVNGTGTNGGSQYIPAHQGFFVRRTQPNFAPGTIKMDNDVRVHNTTAFYKSLNNNTLRLKVEGNNYSDETVMRFSENGSTGFDQNDDAYKMFGYPEVPQLYTKTVDGALLSINTNYSLIDSASVPLLVKVGVNGTYTITASEISSFNTNVLIVIEDNKNGISQILNTNPIYSFYADTLDAPNRFTVKFITNTNKVEDNDDGDMILFVSNKDLYVNLSSVNTQNANLEVFNLSGQIIMNKLIFTNQLNTIHTELPVGCYLIRISNNSVLKTSKIIIH